MERNRSHEKSLRKPSGAAVRCADLTETLYHAFFEEWAERGFGALSLERVAACAHAGKAAIYGLFPSRLPPSRRVLESGPRAAGKMGNGS